MPREGERRPSCLPPDWVCITDGGSCVAMGRMNELTPTEMPHREHNELNLMLFKGLGEAQMDAVKEHGSKGAASVCACVCVRARVRTLKCVLGHVWADDDRKTGVHPSEVQIKVNSNSGVRQSLFAIHGTGRVGPARLKALVGWEGAGSPGCSGGTPLLGRGAGGRMQVTVEVWAPRWPQAEVSPAGGASFLVRIIQACGLKGQIG